MAIKAIKQQYNEVLNRTAYLVVAYPEALKKLLKDHGIYFTGVPTPRDYSDAIISKFKENDKAFEVALESLMKQLNPNEEDEFLGGLIKGAVGIVGGLIRKRKARRQRKRAARAAAQEDQAYARSQAAQAKRALELRIQQMQAAQAQKAAEERQRREQEARQRKEEAAKREAAQKQKTQTMLMIGGGVLVLGLGAVFMMRSNKPSYPYPSMHMPTPPTP